MKIGDRVRIIESGREGRVTRLPFRLWPGGPMSGVHIELDNPPDKLLRGGMSYWEHELEVLD